MIKTAKIGHAGPQGILTGMAKGRVPKVMSQCHRLDQIIIQPQGARHRPRNLRHFDGMGHARAEVIALVIDKDLGLVLQLAKRRGMQDAVSVPLIGRAADKLARFIGALGFGMDPPA